MHEKPAHPRPFDTAALRTLGVLERTLRRHIDELMKLDCEDVEAGEAIVFTIEAAERALANTDVVRRRINGH